MRIVTVVATKGGQVKKYETEATTWGALRDIIQGDYSLSNIKATENINKSTLEHVDCALPEGDFRVFLRPSKTKSGGAFDGKNFKEMRAIIAAEGEDAKKFLSAYRAGKNWTQLTTDDLVSGMNAYQNGAPAGNSEVVTEAAPKKEKKAKKGKKVKPSKEVAEKVADVVSSLPGSDNLPANYAILSPADKCKTITDMLNVMMDQVADDDSINEDSQDEIEQLIHSSLDEIHSLSQAVDGNSTREVNPLAISKAEQAEIDAEMRELERGF